MSLLTGRALKWAIAAVGRDSRLGTHYQEFIREFKLVFDHPTDGPDTASRLHGLRQGTRSVADYTVEFRILAADSGWGDPALKSAYRRGLSDNIKDLILQKRPDTLNALVALALQVDERLRERNQERAQRTAATPRVSTKPIPRPTPGDHFFDTSPSGLGSSTPAKTDEKPMQLGRSRLTAEVREQRMRDRLCLYCGNGGHLIRACPIRPKDPAH